MVEIIIDWLQAALRWAAPLLIVSIGEVYAERSGVINMGIEGIMLFGALAGIAVGFYMKSLLMAVIITILIGALLGLIVAFLTVSRRTNQVVTGLMVNMACLGATDALFSLMSETRQSRVATFPALFPQSMHNIPVLGPLFFSQPVSTWVAFILPFIAGFILYKTRWGLNVRAVGDNPKAAATAGLSVIKIQVSDRGAQRHFCRSGRLRLDTGRGWLFLRRRYGSRPWIHRYGGLRGRRLGPHPHRVHLLGLRRCGCGSASLPNSQLGHSLSVSANAALHHHHCGAGDHGQTVHCAQNLGRRLRS